MAVSVHWGDRVILIPRTDLPLVQASPEVRSLDITWLHYTLRSLEASVDGIGYPPTHTHAEELVLSGQTYVRAVAIVNGYTVEFEDGFYGVSAQNGNNNLLDVKVPNSVSYAPNNSAGALVVESGVSGLTPEEAALLVELLATIRAESKKLVGHIWAAS